MAEGTLAELKRAILLYDVEAAQRWARQAVKEGIDPLESIDAMTAAIREVGDGFGRGDLWLPDLIGAANAMKHSAPIIEEEIRRAGLSRASAGSVVIGTVFGDIHDIGKNMVSSLLTASGFEVTDLGVDVPIKEIIAKAQELDADIIACSALLTTSMPFLRDLVNLLDAMDQRDRFIVMVGGASVTPDYTAHIKADGTAANAMDAVKEARRLIRTKRGSGGDG